MDKVAILAQYYPLEDLLEQNDVEVELVVRYLVEEGLVDPDDYFYDEEMIDD